VLVGVNDAASWADRDAITAPEEGTLRGAWESFPAK
jgi:hypothetical protein